MVISDSKVTDEAMFVKCELLPEGPFHRTDLSSIDSPLPSMDAITDEKGSDDESIRSIDSSIHTDQQKGICVTYPLFRF